MLSWWALTRKRKFSSEEEAGGGDSSGNTSDAELEAAAVTKMPYEELQYRNQKLEVWRSFPESCTPHFTAFLKLFDDGVIRNFLRVDACAKLADKYLLVMVYVYFRRAGLSLQEYSIMNFFIALYLANDIEEDDEDEKYEIFPWALGRDWGTLFPAFLRNRDRLWSAMSFRAVVSRRTCEEVLAVAPPHMIWSRVRHSHHGGAIRPYLKPDTPTYGRKGPPHCVQCRNATTLVQSKENQGVVSKISSLTPLDFWTTLTKTSQNSKNHWELGDYKKTAKELSDFGTIYSHEP